MSSYTIYLAGHLDPRWATAFAGWTLTHTFSADQRPVTAMTGPIRDQAALYGLISRVRDLGFVLISLQPAGDL
ncbi:MAG: hypothetical protein HGA45_43550 [Chloroflexales bacterium]|nr:hypothetical protein [Chloroflexales bacterium]